MRLTHDPADTPEKREARLATALARMDERGAAA